MKLYNVTYRQWNDSFSDMYDCEELSVGNTPEEAIEKVKNNVEKDARDFEAEDISKVFGYYVIISNNQEQEKYSEMLKERIKSNYEEHIHSNWNLPIEKKYIVDMVQSVGFKFDEEEARVLLQFKNPLTVMYENMDFDDSTYFHEALFNMHYEMQGIDILTQKYEIDKEMLLPETVHRHKAINYLIETFPNYTANSNKGWIINFKVKNEHVMENPYEEMINEFDAIKQVFGEEVMHHVYAAGGNHLIDKEHMMFAAEYLKNGGLEEDVHQAIREFNQDEGMAMQ